MAAPTPIETVSEYIAAVAKSKLLSEADALVLRQKWERDTRGQEAEVDSYRRYLQKRQALTEYQGKLIQRGRSDGFLMGKYTILDRIGSGQMAGVYKAKHESGQVVAIKVLPSSKAKDGLALNRFQREGRLVTQLDHPNVVRAFEIGQSGNVHFIVMEHLEGETLDSIFAKRKQLPVPEAVRLAYHALLGLQHLHERNMVHRDIKPANLMILALDGKKHETTLDSIVKILDIGLGRELFDEDSPATQDLHLTGEGAILGTPDYMAPEQARDARSADVRADIYSVGCVLFEAIAGRPPFTDKNIMAQMVKHATEKPLALADLVKGIPSGLSTLVARILEKLPANRPQTPEEAANLLKPYLPEKGGTSESVPILPAYRQWLASESAFELPADIEAKAPKPAQAEMIRPSAPVPPPPPRPKPAPESKPVAAPPSRPPSGTIPKLLAGVSPENMIDVELVEMPAPIVIQAPAALEPEEEEEEEERGLFELNRRDFIMLGGGALSVLLAIGAGYGLSRMIRKKPEEETPPTTKPEG